MCRASSHIALCASGTAAVGFRAPARSRSRSGSRTPQHRREQSPAAASASRALAPDRRGRPDARLSALRVAISACATGLWNGRSASSNVSSALVPVWPSGVTRHQTADDRQAGPRMRRQILLVEAVRRFRIAARQRNRHHQRRRIRPVAQPQLGLQAGHAVVVRDLPWQSRLLSGRRATRLLAPGDGGRLVGDHGQRPGGQRLAVTLHRQQAAARSGPTRPGNCCCRAG